MIGMLMGYEQGRQAFGSDTDKIKAPADFPRRQTGVDQKSRLTRFYQYGVAFAATGQQADFHS